MFIWIYRICLYSYRHIYIGYVYIAISIYIYIYIIYIFMYIYIFISQTLDVVKLMIYLRKEHGKKANANSNMDSIDSAIWPYV